MTDLAKISKPRKYISKLMELVHMTFVAVIVGI